MLLFSFSEFLKSGFVEGLDFFVNLITAFGLIAGIPWALLNKDNNKLAAKISNYLHYCVRLTILILLVVGLCDLGRLFYEILFYGVFSVFGYNTDGTINLLKQWAAIFMAGAVFLSLGLILGSFVMTSSWYHALLFRDFFRTPQGKYRKRLESFEIIYASYGIEGNEVDVTEVLQNLIINNRLNFVVNNRHLTDPCMGQIKRLRVKFKFGNGEFVKEFQENETLNLPPSD